jgi:hypothetical protein
LRPKHQILRRQCHEINKEVRLKNEYAFVHNFLKVWFQTIYFLRFGLKSYFLFTKLQYQMHLKSAAYIYYYRAFPFTFVAHEEYEWTPYTIEIVWIRMSKLPTKRMLGLRFPTISIQIVKNFLHLWEALNRIYLSNCKGQTIALGFSIVRILSRFMSYNTTQTNATNVKFNLEILI